MVALRVGLEPMGGAGPAARGRANRAGLSRSSRSQSAASAVWRRLRCVPDGCLEVRRLTLWGGDNPVSDLSHRPNVVPTSPGSPIRGATQEVDQWPRTTD